MFCALRGASRLLRPPLAAGRASYATAAPSTSNASSNSIQAALNRSTSLFKTYKPVTPGLRHLKRPLTPHLYEGRPVRELTVALRKKGGRNNKGRITVRHRGGGHRQRLRLVDFRREQPGVYDVARIEYDPGRSAHIALVRNRDPNATGLKKWSYILATEGMRAGDQVQSFRRGIPEGFIPGFEQVQKEAEPEQTTTAETSEATAEGEQSITPAETAEAPQASDNAESLAAGLLRTLTIKPGNVLPLRLIPVGTMIHNISLKPDGPGILVRSAGSSGQVMDNKSTERYVHVKLQSGEVRKILRDCCATIGQVSNPLWKQRSLGKAGRARWLGIRPSVRGVAMNANDHPHGGGRGKSKSNKHPVSIWGWGTKGTRTRKPGPKGPKNSNKMVIRERPRGKEKRAN